MIFYELFCIVHIPITFEFSSGFEMNSRVYPCFKPLRTMESRKIGVEKSLHGIMP